MISPLSVAPTGRFFISSKEEKEPLYLRFTFFSSYIDDPRGIELLEYPSI